MYYLEGLRTLSRPTAEHDVELPGVVEDTRSQLLKYKASVPPSVLAFTFVLAIAVQGYQKGTKCLA